MASDEKLINSEAQTLLEKMGLKGAVSTEKDQENDAFRVDISLESEEDNPLLIGYHGEHLNSFQTILGNIVWRKAGEFRKVLVETAGYRKAREEDIKRTALEAVDKARFLTKEVHLPPMNAWERRVVHVVLAEEKDVSTESQGEGPQRHVVVVPSSLKAKAEAVSKLEGDSD